VPLTAAGVLVLPPQTGGAQGGARAEEHSALFPVCAGPVRVTCVVDGDTPEVSQPGCPQERALGRRATERLRELLNAGGFTLEIPPDGRTRDRYGRELRIVTRGGRSLGAALVAEGLAVR